MVTNSAYDAELEGKSFFDVYSPPDVPQDDDIDGKDSWDYYFALLTLGMLKLSMP